MKKSDVDLSDEWEIIRLQDKKEKNGIIQRVLLKNRITGEVKELKEKEKNS